MSSMPGRPANKGTFKKGNTASVGNDKTQSFAVWLEKELKNKVGDLESITGYDKELERKAALAKKLIEKALKEKDSGSFKVLFAEIADRTEGKPTQPIDHTSKGERLFDNLTDEQLRESLKESVGRGTSDSD